MKQKPPTTLAPVRGGGIVAAMKPTFIALLALCLCVVGCGEKTLEQRAEAGDAKAQFKLGVMYRDGKGVRRTTRKQ